MIGEFNIQLITNYHQIRWKQACSTSIMLFQEETRLLKPKSGGNKLAQHQLCFSKGKQGCSSPNQVETSLLNINYAFPRWNKVAQAQIRWKQACSTSSRFQKWQQGSGNNLAQHHVGFYTWKQGCSSLNHLEISLKLILNIVWCPYNVLDVKCN